MNDDIIDIRNTLLAEVDRTILQQNALRDCDIALRLVRCTDESAAEAADRVRMYHKSGQLPETQADTLKRMKLLVERYAAAKVNAELTYADDASLATRKKHDARESAAYDALITAIDELVNRAFGDAP